MPDAKSDPDRRLPSPVTVLVVDDAPDIRLLARALLEREGFDVVAMAEDGLEALQAFHELDAPPVPTVILLDNRMPHMGGLETAARILSEVPDQLIVLFSAHLNAADVAEAERMGVAACVPKNDASRIGTVVREVIAAR